MSSDEPDAESSLVELAMRVATLGRDCPWTEQQTARSALAMLLDEVAEVEEALDQGAPPSDVMAELGDVLFNALLTIEVCAREVPIADDALLAESATASAAETAAACSLRKLRRRYPPLFDGTLQRQMPLEYAAQLWREGKAAEVEEQEALRASAGPTTLAGADAKARMEGAVEKQAMDKSRDDDGWDATLAAELAELDRLEAANEEMSAREQLARLVMEELAQEQVERDAAS